jgi:cytosine/creatinine deaminase
MSRSIRLGAWNLSSHLLWMHMLCWLSLWSKLALGFLRAASRWGAIFHTDGTLLGVGRNRLVQEGNGSLHGETDAFRAAGRRPAWHDTILVTTLAPCWYCTGLIYQFRFRQVIVGDSVNAQGGLNWLREQGIDIVDLHSQECIDMIAEFQRIRPDLWKECIGEA